jgi:hypothetical protein
MTRGFKIMLPFTNWPAEDQDRWEVAFKGGDRFDDSDRGAHLAPATRQARRASYARFLGFISAVHPVGLLPHLKRGSIGISWPNMLCGAEDRAETRRSPSILTTFAARGS